MTRTWTKSTCPYCGVGCGVLVRTAEDGLAAEVKGDPDHPANHGRLCSKGTALGATMSDDGRLLAPRIDGGTADWSAALDLVARRFGEAIATHGPNSVAFYVSGQLLTEDYYVANKLMKGFIGSANIDTNSRLCMASSVAAHKRAFGSDTVPGCYEDLDEADLVVLVGSNLAWCHPVLFQRLAAARERRGTQVVVIDPRRTATCAIADRHLALASGSDVALFNGLLAHLAASGVVDGDYVGRHTVGLVDALATARAMSFEALCNVTGLAPAELEAFFKLFAQTERVVTIYSQGVNQSSSGTDKVNAILNCHLATGRIGKPGMGPLSVTGQPNAMGGREVGGLANMLAAHMEIGNADHRRLVQSFWRAPTIASQPGLKAVDLFRAVGDGRIQALWIMATNPVVSMPEADLVRDAIGRCPFVVVSDVEAETDTTRHAHVLLPSSGWGEKDGTVTNSERRVSRQRRFRASPGLARPDWWQLAEVAKRMGFHDAFAWTSTAAIFAEYAALTGKGNAGSRDLDLSAFDGISRADYDALEPFQWPQEKTAVSVTPKRFFGDGKFFTPDRRARFIATPFRASAETTTKHHGFLLNTGRIRDQWHTMTRTGRAPQLSSHAAEPFAEIHPGDAAALGIAPADLLIASNARGSVILRACVTDRVPRGTVFVPFHWSDGNASRARVDVLLTAHVDPVSGQPELKRGAVAIERWRAHWYAFAAGVGKPLVPCAEYWSTARTASGWRIEIAATYPLMDGASLLAALWPQYADAELLSYCDGDRGIQRVAAYDGDTLLAVVFAGPSPVACQRDHVVSKIGQTGVGGLARLGILAGRAGDGEADAGSIMCACMGVGRKQILSVIARARGACTIDLVGEATGAGTNCGSCRAEIGGLIHATVTAKAS